LTVARIDICLHNGPASCPPFMPAFRITFECRVNTDHKPLTTMHAVLSPGLQIGLFDSNLRYEKGPRARFKVTYDLTSPFLLTTCTHLVQTGRFGSKCTSYNLDSFLTIRSVVHVSKECKLQGLTTVSPILATARTQVCERSRDHRRLFPRAPRALRETT
jgi:hypothetical protein